MSQDGHQPDQRFSILPVEVLLDHRLTLIETRVLCAILSFRNKNTNVSWPSREAISERCGYAVGTVSNATKTLVEKGWLVKKKARFTGPNDYEVTVPDGIERHRSGDTHGFDDNHRNESHRTDETHRSDDNHQSSEHESHRSGELEPHRSGDTNLPRTDHRTNHIRRQPKPSTAKPLPCPHVEILSAYHEVLPELTHHIAWDGTRKTNLQTRWRENKTRQSVDWWRGLFEHVRGSDFLMGRQGKPWKADLAWIVKRENLTKIQEGKYHS